MSRQEIIKTSPEFNRSNRELRDVISRKNEPCNCVSALAWWTTCILQNWNPDHDSKSVGRRQSSFVTNLLRWCSFFDTDSSIRTCTHYTYKTKTCWIRTLLSTSHGYNFSQPRKRTDFILSLEGDKFESLFNKYMNEEVTTISVKMEKNLFMVLFGANQVYQPDLLD